MDKSLDYILSICAVVGQTVLAFCGLVGRFFTFVGMSLIRGIQPPYYPRVIAEQFIRIGFLSLPVIGLTALFTGAVLALQIYIGGSRFNAEGIVASIVVLGITRELGPVLGGLMLAGRVAAAIAAEIGTMKVSEQIDALTTLSTDPMRYLVFPRLLAATLSMPILVLVADIIGVWGGFLVGTNRLGFDPATYLNNTIDFLQTEDVLSGLAKAAVFGFLIAAVGCYQGFHADRGAQGVGKATTHAVVLSCVLILAANYILTEVFFSQ
ncbi:MAG: MlaE family ABC transporter permease [Alphaproteobacteria bacterium]|jgi:phospholipid/cholesterol/gamma-HCH transport system permease protein